MVQPPNRCAARFPTAGLSSPSLSQLDADESGAPAGADEASPLAGPRPSPPLPAVPMSVPATAPPPGLRTPQSPSRYSRYTCCVGRGPRCGRPGQVHSACPCDLFWERRLGVLSPSKSVPLFRPESPSQSLAPADHGHRHSCSAPGCSGLTGTSPTSRGPCRTLPCPAPGSAPPRRQGARAALSGAGRQRGWPAYVTAGAGRGGAGAKPGALEPLQRLRTGREPNSPRRGDGARHAGARRPGPAWPGRVLVSVC